MSYLSNHKGWHSTYAAALILALLVILLAACKEKPVKTVEPTRLMSSLDAVLSVENGCLKGGRRTLIWHHDYDVSISDDTVQITDNYGKKSTLRAGDRVRLGGGSISQESIERDVRLRDQLSEICPGPYFLAWLPSDHTTDLQQQIPHPTETHTDQPTSIPTSTVAPDDSPMSTPTSSAVPSASHTEYLVSDELTFEFISQQGGSVNGVALAGSVAYIGLGPRLAALDISEPANPVQIGQSEVLPGQVTALLLRNNIAYVGAGRFVFTLDVNDPTDIHVLGETKLPGAVSRLLLYDNVLYAGGKIYEGDFTYSGFIGTVDVDQVDKLILLDWIETPGAVQSLALSEQSLYFGQSGVPRTYYLDVAYPRWLGRPMSIFDLEAYSLRIIGDRLYIGGYSYIVRISITDPHQSEGISWSGSEDAPSGIINDMDLHKDAMIVTGIHPAGAYIPFRHKVGLSEPDADQDSVLISSNTAVSSDHLFVARYTLEIYEINDLQGDPIGIYDSPLYPTGEMAVSREQLFLLEREPTFPRSSQLSILQLPELTVLGQFTATLPMEWQFGFYGIAVTDDRAVLAAEDGLWQIDVKDPTFPLLLGTIEMTEFLELVSVAPLVVDGIVYLALSPFEGLQSMDITDPDNPQPIDILQDLGGWMIRLLASGDGLLYAATDDEYGQGIWLHTIELSDGEMTLIGYLNLPGRIYDLAVWNDYVLAVGSEGLSVVSVADPEHPQVISQIALPGDGLDVEVKDDIVFVIAGGQGYHSLTQLLAFEFSDSVTLRPIGALDIATPGDLAFSNLAISSDYLIVTGSQVGVTVLSYNY